MATNTSMIIQITNMTTPTMTAAIQAMLGGTVLVSTRCSAGLGTKAGVGAGNNHS